jgi:2-polyprenyl-6-methoxyphenol hydroxylase-like FAD-dependent oxidoreductase
MTGSMTSVLIVGAGPVGLALACELGLRGIAAMLIEKRDGSIPVPKQSMVSSRSMELCRRWGIAPAVRAAVWPQSHPRDFVYAESLRGRELLRVKLPSFAARERDDITPEPPCPCPQTYFDPILTERVKTFATVQIRYNIRLDVFSQDDEGVAAQLTDTRSGATESVTAHYLVGCDGPAGVVREALGIVLVGDGTIANSLNLFFRSAALAPFHDKGWARFYRVIDETGCWAELIPIDGKELWRLTVFDEPASAENPDALLRKMAGGAFDYEMLSVVPWQRREHVASRYGEGRVFIAGDAAHECSPTGGIGMHTALEERQPIALRNVELATRSFAAIAAIPGTRAPEDPQWRANPSPWLSVPEHLKLQYVYEDSPICVGDGAAAPDPEPPRFVASTRPGTRAPHAWLADGRSTLDLFGDGFVLLRLGHNAPDAARLLHAGRMRGVPMREISIGDPHIAALYEKRLVLVRPDGHVGWRGDDVPADAGGIIDRLRGCTSP